MIICFLKSRFLLLDFLFHFHICPEAVYSYPSNVKFSSLFFRSIIINPSYYHSVLHFRRFYYSLILYTRTLHSCLPLIPFYIYQIVLYNYFLNARFYNFFSILSDLCLSLLLFRYFSFPQWDYVLFPWG